MSPHSLVNKVQRRFLRIAFRLFQSIRILVYRSLSSNQPKGRPILYQPLQTEGLGEIVFSGKIKIGVFPSPFFFNTYAYLEARNKTAKIAIGDATWINNGFSAIAEHTSITVGQRVFIGTNVEIFDSDFHGIRVSDRHTSRPVWAKPVVIEDDVFIGSNVRIMKGVTIGRGSVVANSAVVVKSIPAGVIAGGNPARVLREIE